MIFGLKSRLIHVPDPKSGHGPRLGTDGLLFATEVHIDCMVVAKYCSADENLALDVADPKIKNKSEYKIVSVIKPLYNFILKNKSPPT